MKNTKQPIYDKSNLIDFKRKNLWMGRIEKSSNPSNELKSMLVIAFVIIAIIYLVNFG